MARDIIDITEVAQKRVEVVSGILTYIGVARVSSPATSDPVWQISRIVVENGETITEYADNGNFTQIWDDRDTTSVFPLPPFENTKSVAFDGVNEILNGGDIHNYDIADPWTISLWVKPSDPLVEGMIFSKAGPLSAVEGYMVRLKEITGYLYFQMRTTTVYRNHTFASSLTAGSWNHVVFTYDGSSNMNGLKLYVDGVLDSSLPPSGVLSGTLLNNQDFIIGARNSQLYFDGNIDEITVWNSEIDQAGVTELYNSGAPEDPTYHTDVANLQSWYRCGDGDTSPTVTDNQGTDDLTMTNMDSGNFETDVP